jgi:hypothetical protein
MRILLLLAGLTLALAAHSQEIWRWVDKDGVVHYADQPGTPDAELISVAEPNAYESVSPPPDYARGSTSVGGAVPSPYNSVVIVQPTEDQVFFGADATVRVVAELDGTLQPDHSLAFFVNGERRPASSGFGIELRELPRGTYVLRATVVSAANTPVITSDQVVFHVRQPSINSPQSPQRPRPRTPPPPPPPN